MFPNFSQCALLAAVVTIVHASIAVLLKNNDDLSYVATVQMGTPAQQIQMAVSLSQNDILVASQEQGGNDVAYYNPALSMSYKPTTATATIQTISGGSVVGNFTGEICSLKSSNSAKPFTYNASVVLTDPSVTNDVYPVGAWGILGCGVAPAPPGSPPNNSLIDTYLRPNFTSTFFGIELNHHNDPVPDGILTMGAVDPTAFTGNFTNVVVPQNTTTSWSIPLDGLTDLANRLLQSSSGLICSIDIYYTGIQVTTSMAGQIYAGIPGSQLISDTVWSLPCNSTFPLALTFGGTAFTMNERDTIVMQPNGACTGVVTGGAGALGQVGAPFLRNVYTQFGEEKASDGTVTFLVGFATKVLRQVSSTSGAPQMIVQDAGLFSTLAVASIITTIFW